MNHPLIKSGTINLSKCELKDNYNVAIIGIVFFAFIEYYLIVHFVGLKWPS